MLGAMAKQRSEMTSTQDILPSIEQYAKKTNEEESGLGFVAKAVHPLKVKRNNTLTKADLISAKIKPLGKRYGEESTFKNKVHAM
jgi:hypothetical protein